MINAIFVAVSLAVGVASYFMYRPPENNQADMAPANLDAFGITTAEEGKCIPRVFGRVRLPGNILWYGNLVSKAQYQDVAGGKGGGKSKKAKTGYKYWLDMWQGVCVGPATPVKVYVQDRPHDWDDWVSGVEAQVNGGFDGTYPTAPGKYASSLPGICHIWLPQYYLGFNVQSAPTIHYLMDCYPPTPVAHAKLPNGMNPAAIIYTLLTDAGAKPDMIDLPSFNAAAKYWAQRGYGLNIAFTRQGKARENIAEVLKYVGGRFLERGDGLFILRADDPDQPLIGTVTDKDIISLNFSRQTWEKTPNSFEGKYSDEIKEYTTRTSAPARNTASINLVGREIRQSVDLSAFRDVDTANKRLWEIMKRQSYPAATMTLTTNLAFASAQPGDILAVSSERDGITPTFGTVTSIDLTEIDKNEVKLELTEAVGRVVDNAWTPPAPPEPWHPPVADPIPLKHVRVVELPRNPYSGDAPMVVLLAARPLGYEDGCAVLQSGSGTDYTLLQTMTAWSQYGVLQSPYPSSTYAIDDDLGFIYKPTREDPVFESVSREQLFTGRRVAIVGDEIMAFQMVELLPDGAIRLKGLVRGVYNTPVQDHDTGAAIWLTELGDNVTQLDADCSLLFLPSVLSHQLPRDVAPAVAVHITGRAAMPFDVARIEAVRTGDTVALRWWPVDVEMGGAGEKPPQHALDQWPPQFKGDFLVAGQSVSACHTVITSTNNVTIRVQARQSGQVTPGKHIYVPNVDGTYIA